MFNYQDIYHVGVRVKNIEEAMEEMGKGLQLTWCDVQDKHVLMLQPQGVRQDGSKRSYIARYFIFS